MKKKVTRQITEEPGVFLNGTARTALFEDYRDALSNHKFINRSESGMQECLQFIRKPDGSIEHSASANSQDPSGARTAHGDEVVADALACMGVTEHEALSDIEPPEIPVGSLAWRQQQRAAELAAAQTESLGEGW